MKNKMMYLHVTIEDLTIEKFSCILFLSTKKGLNKEGKELEIKGTLYERISMC